MIRIGIVGTGSVAASVAISTLHAGIAQRLLLHDLREAVAEGEAMDLADGAPFYAPASVRAAPLDALLDTDAIVLAAGRNGRPDETRLDLLRDNGRVMRDLARRLRGYRGLVIVVTNPVDVLTRVVTLESQLPPARVLGTGTMLDTARLRHAIGERLQVDARSIHAQVVGEHGDSEVVLWSNAQCAGVPLRAWPGWSRELEPVVAAEVRTSAYEIIRRKGVTNHAIGLVTAGLLRTMLRDERRALTVSRVQEGAAGVSGVAMSLPAIVGRDGAVRVIEPRLDDGEREALLTSAAVLQRAAASIA